MLLEEECQSTRDLGFGDEIKDSRSRSSVTPENNIFSFSPKSFYKSNPKPVVSTTTATTTTTAHVQQHSFLKKTKPSSKKKKKKTKKNTSHFNRPVLTGIQSEQFPTGSSPLPPLSVIQDPKIMLQQVKVKIEKLPAKQITSNIIMSVSDDLCKQVNVSPKRRKRDQTAANASASPSDDIHSWFAKRSKHSPPTTPQKSTPPTPSGLIRPAILNVQSPSSKVQQKFSSNSSNSTSISSQNNPFLPSMKSSSYLFDGLEDFEQAEEIIEEDEEALSGTDAEEESPINLVEDNKEGYEEQAPSLIQVDKAIVKEIEKEEEKEKKKGEEEKGKEEQKKDEDFKTPQRIRFPAQEPKNLIECKWKGCQMVFTTFGSLSDHLKVRRKKTRLFFVFKIVFSCFRGLAPRRFFRREKFPLFFASCGGQSNS